MANRKHDSDDAEAFRAAVRDVTPLKAAPRAARQPPKKRIRKPAAHPVALDLNESMPLIPIPGDAPETAAATLEFHRGGVRDQVLRKLRRGLFPVEEELDLHGCTQTAARMLLAEFLAASRDAGHRCVRVIHGKGYRSGGRGPVLKVAVDLWLRRHLDVLAFASAKAIDGGTGAVYVLLRS